MNSSGIFFKSPHHSLLALGLIIVLLTTGCSLSGRSPSTNMPNVAKGSKAPRGTRPYTIRGKTYYPILNAHNFKERGVASWYGSDFHGKTTANGERYDMYGMTAAHKTLPFDTHVRVTNKTNGRSVVVRINDRGPFVDNRVIDLTHTAAKHLDMLGPGTAPVHVEAIRTKPPTQKTDLQGTYYVQLGAFSQKNNAHRLVQMLQGQGTKARAVLDRRSSMWIVQAGPFQNIRTADSVAQKFKKQFPNNFVAAE